MTGLHRDVVKAIDKARLESLYTEVGGDGKRRLRDEGDEEAAKALKGSKYILMTKGSTRLGKDRDARAGKVVPGARRPATAAGIGIPSAWSATVLRAFSSQVAIVHRVPL